MVIDDSIIDGYGADDGRTLGSQFAAEFARISKGT